LRVAAGGGDAARQTGRAGRVGDSAEGVAHRGERPRERRVAGGGGGTLRGALRGCADRQGAQRPDVRGGQDLLLLGLRPLGAGGGGPHFPDHFSRVAATYAAYRPSQPDALIRWAVGLAPRRVLAWDCGTGNGQAARAVAEYFARVVATDASEAQLAQAVAHPR